MTGKKSNLGDLLVRNGIGRPMRWLRSFRFNAVGWFFEGRKRMGQIGGISGGYSIRPAG
jgi:hypothetical protein